LLLLHAVVIGLASIMLVPLVWTISTSLKTPGAAYLFPPKWIPDWPFRWENYSKSFTSLPFDLY
jgi:ABC-type glycerol-3-phosphate transport system permease component